MVTKYFVDGAKTAGLTGLSALLCWDEFKKKGGPEKSFQKFRTAFILSVDIC